MTDSELNIEVYALVMIEMSKAQSRGWSPAEYAAVLAGAAVLAKHSALSKATQEQGAAVAKQVGHAVALIEKNCGMVNEAMADA